MEKLHKYVNYILVALLLITPAAVAYGSHKQERIEVARQGQ